MKIYTREELETLATESPQELVLLFMQNVEGFQNARYEMLVGKNRLVYEIDGRSYYTDIDYLTDWTAVINAGKKAGIFYCLTDFSASASKVASLRGKNKLQQQPDWPDCAALMIVMIEVMQK